MKCAIPVDSAGYGVQTPTDVLATKLDGGASRYRQDVIGATETVNVQWTVDAKDYDYLRAFFRQNKAKPFEIDLVLDSSKPEEYTAYFVPGSFGLTQQQGLTYMVAAILEVIPLPPDEASDTLILGQFEA